mmetsp:Transcript_20018/g.31756  ORF Transcript_20018/g.31756 Transcript_20018/m.31756 type:complete len:902 (-) Transcript_20018:154-2859(-)
MIPTTENSEMLPPKGPGGPGAPLPPPAAGGGMPPRRGALMPRGAGGRSIPRGRPQPRPAARPVRRSVAAKPRTLGKPRPRGPGLRSSRPMPKSRPGLRSGPRRMPPSSRGPPLPNRLADIPNQNLNANANRKPNSTPLNSLKTPAVETPTPTPVPLHEKKEDAALQGEASPSKHPDNNKAPEPTPSQPARILPPNRSSWGPGGPNRRPHKATFRGPGPQVPAGGEKKPKAPVMSKPKQEETKSSGSQATPMSEPKSGVEHSTSPGLRGETPSREKSSPAAGPLSPPKLAAGGLGAATGRRTLERKSQNLRPKPRSGPRPRPGPRPGLRPAPRKSPLMRERAVPPGMGGRKMPPLGGAPNGPKHKPTSKPNVQSPRLPSADKSNSPPQPNSPNLQPKSPNQPPVQSTKVPPPGKIYDSAPVKAADLKESTPGKTDIKSNDVTPGKPTKVKSAATGLGFEDVKNRDLLPQLLDTEDELATTGIGSYSMADPGERKQFLVPIPPSDGGACGCGATPEENTAIHMKADLPFFTGVGLRSGRVALGGGGGMAGMGVGSGINIYDVRPDCALIPFATFNSNDKLVNCIAEHPCGSELAVSMEGAVFAFLISSIGDSFDCIDSWTVIPGAAASTSDPQPKQTKGEDDEEEELPQVTALEFSPSGDMIATGGEDGKVRIWKYHSKQMLAILNVTAEGEDVTSIAFTRDSKRIITCSKSPSAGVWTIDGKLERKLALPPQLPEGCVFRHFRVVRSMRMTRFGGVEENIFGIATVNGPKDSFLVKTNIGGEWEPTGAVSVPGEVVTTCTVTSAGDQLALSTRTGTVMVYSCDSLECVKAIANCHGLPGTALCFTSNSEMLVSASMDKTYSLVPVQPLSTRKSKPGFLQGLIRLMFQIFIVVVIAHVVTWRT